MRLERTHEIHLDMPVSETFPLFTPKGEEAWVPGWQPTYIEPDSGETTAEMLFRTGTGEDVAFWACLAYEPDKYHARYLRITPASRIAFVDVRCREAGVGGAVATVGYGFVPLNDAGHRYVAAMTPEAFSEMIEDWGRLIRAARLPIEDGKSAHFGSRVIHHD